jgi:serine/threonine-protein kinase
MFSQLLSQPPIPLNAARPNLRFPASVEQVIMRGLNKDPRQRYADSLAFAQELADALSKTEEPSKSGLFSRVKDIFKR